MKTINHIIMLTIFFGAQNLCAQPGDMPLQHEPGKCYARCQIEGEYEEVEVSFPIYTGETTDEVQLDSVYFSIDQISGNLIYLGFEEDLDEKQIQLKNNYEKIVFLRDTVKTDDYVEETITYQKLKKGGHNTQWKEVVCGDRMNSDLIIRIQRALMRKGYLKSVKSVMIITSNMKAALIEYQKDSHLPIGQFDKETLETLDIRI